MGFLSRIFGRGEAKSVSSLDLWRQVFGGRASSSGPSVNWSTALEVTTVLSCVRVIANGVAQIPWKVYREDGVRRAVASDHRLHMLLWRRPNAWQTAFELRRTVMAHLLLTGNAFVWIGRVSSSREVAVLEPIEPGRVTVERRPDTTLTYKVRADDGATARFGADEIWHLRGLSWDGWRGLDSVKLARDAIGLSMATERAHADLHRAGARISGVYSVQNALGKEKFEQLSDWLESHADGGARAGKPLIVDLGATWTPMQMKGVDAQHLETRKHQIEEICRAFGVMPIMVGHADKTATYASAEQMFQAHVVHTLAPHYEYLEQAADVALLGEAGLAAGLYTKFLPNALMRGTAKDRAEFYAKGLGAGGGKGWLTQNQVRELEDMDPSDDPKADELPQPLGAPPAADPPSP